MVDVTCLYIFYLLLDSIESTLVYFDRSLWTPPKIVAYHANYAIFLFAVISGVLLRMPLFALLIDLGKNIESLYDMHVWMIFTLITVIIILVFGNAANSSWGNIQNLAARFAFLSYCSYHLWPERAVLIPLIAIAAACIVGVEIKKYGWSLRELRKKDIRFRRNS
jgi:hypothetical protein